MTGINDYSTNSFDFGLGSALNGASTPDWFGGMARYGMPAGNGSPIALPSSGGMAAGGSGFSLGNILGKDGWGGLALSGLGTLLNGWMGMQQYGLMQKSLQQSQDQFNRNYSAQRQIVNSQLRDRQAARVASNPGAYQSVADYMSQNGIN